MFKFAHKPKLLLSLIFFIGTGRQDCANDINKIASYLVTKNYEGLNTQILDDLYKFLEKKETKFRYLEFSQPLASLPHYTKILKHFCGSQNSHRDFMRNYHYSTLFFIHIMRRMVELPDLVKSNNNLFEFSSDYLFHNFILCAQQNNFNYFYLRVLTSFFKSEAQHIMSPFELAIKLKRPEMFDWIFNFFSACTTMKSEPNWINFVNFLMKFLQRKIFLTQGDSSVKWIPSVKFCYEKCVLTKKNEHVMKLLLEESTVFIPNVWGMKHNFLTYLQLISIEKNGFAFEKEYEETIAHELIDFFHIKKVIDSRFKDAVLLVFVVLKEFFKKWPSIADFFYKDIKRVCSPDDIEFLSHVVDDLPAYQEAKKNNIIQEKLSQFDLPNISERPICDDEIFTWE